MSTQLGRSWVLAAVKSDRQQMALLSPRHLLPVPHYHLLHDYFPTFNEDQRPLSLLAVLKYPARWAEFLSSQRVTGRVSERLLINKSYVILTESWMERALSKFGNEGPGRVMF